jgi:hypothetical protein
MARDRRGVVEEGAAVSTEPDELQAPNGPRRPDSLCYPYVVVWDRAFHVIHALSDLQTVERRDELRRGRRREPLVWRSAAPVSPGVAASSIDMFDSGIYASRRLCRPITTPSHSRSSATALCL